MALPYEEAELQTKDKTLNYEPDENTKYFLPTNNKKYTTHDDIKKENVVTYDIQYEGANELTNLSSPKTSNHNLHLSFIPKFSKDPCRHVSV